MCRRLPFPGMKAEAEITRRAKKGFLSFMAPGLALARLSVCRCHWPPFVLAHNTVSLLPPDSYPSFSPYFSKWNFTVLLFFREHKMRFFFGGGERLLFLS